MPPHCDSLDGPVARAAIRALEAEDVDAVLPYVHEDGEDEVRQAFELAVKARAQGGDARTVADRYFVETTVRVHRAGEGAPYTGLKPAGLDVGPVIPLAEAAIESGAPDDLADFLAGAARREVEARLAAVQKARPAAESGVAQARRYVEASLGLQVWAHHLLRAMQNEGHDGA